MTAVREHIGDDVPFMVDANQQWDRPTAMRLGRVFEQFNMVWIEEPLDAYDAEGHAQLAKALDTSIATGESLQRRRTHQPDPKPVGRHHPARRSRIGGITPFLRLAHLADQAGLQLAPHFAMEIHLHLAAAYPREPWVEHFEWLNPLFNERLETRDGRMQVPNRPGLGVTLSDQARAWTTDTVEFGRQ